MQDVEFGQWHGLDKFGNSLNLEEMPGAVDHNASVNDKRLIFDLPDLNLVALDHLREGFKSVHIAGIRFDSDGDVRGLSGDWKDVALLVGDFGWVDLDFDVDHGLVVVDQGSVIGAVEVVIFAFQYFGKVVATVSILGLEHGQHVAAIILWQHKPHITHTADFQEPPINHTGILGRREDAMHATNSKQYQQDSRVNLVHASIKIRIDLL